MHSTSTNKLQRRALGKESEPTGPMQKLQRRTTDTQTENPINPYQLHEAIAKNNLEEVESLVNQGADVNQTNPNKDGWTPLMFAVDKCNIRILRILLNAKADPNIMAETPNGKPPTPLNTPLFLAVTREDSMIVRELVLANAITEIPNHLNTTPRKMAFARNNVDVLTALDTPTKLAIPALNDAIDNLCVLLENNSEEEFIKASLEIIVQASEKSSSILLNTYDSRGNLPIFLAMLHDIRNNKISFPCAELLIAHKADLNRHNRSGKTLLYSILERTATNKPDQIEDKQVVAWLLEKKANPALANKNGDTVFHIAANRKKPDLILALNNHLTIENDIRDQKNFQNLRPIDLATNDVAVEAALIEPLQKSQNFTLYTIREEPEPTHDDTALVLYRPGP